MNIALFTKTYPRDYPWLEILAKSLDHFAKGFIRWYVAYDYGTAPPKISTSNIDLRLVETPAAPYAHAPNPFFIKEAGGYNWQQVIKMSWYEYAHNDVDAVLAIDCDSFFINYVSADDLLSNGRLPWGYRAWPDDGAAHRAWKKPSEKFMKAPQPYLYMVRGYHLLTREACQFFNQFVFDMHDMSFAEYSRNNIISEFNFFGSVLHSVNSFNYSLYNMDEVKKHQKQDASIKQSWSYGNEIELARKQVNNAIANH